MITPEAILMQRRFAVGLTAIAGIGLMTVGSLLMVVPRVGIGSEHWWLLPLLGTPPILLVGAGTRAFLRTNASTQASLAAGAATPLPPSA